MSVITKFARVVYANRSAIFMGLGLAFGAGCVATTAVQTIKACDIIEDANRQMDEVEDLIVLEEDKDKQLKTIRKDTNITLAKNYILPVTLGIGSVVCLLASYKILSSQKAAALAALSSVTAAFDKYRSRVIDKYGVEEDYNLYTGRTEIEVTRETTDPKTGKKKTVKDTIVTTDPIDGSCYSRVFSSTTAPGEWCFNQKLCVARLQNCEDNANRILLKRGRYTLNELYMDLGLDCRVGYYATERPIPNGIGWLSREILDAVSDRFPGPYDDKVKFAPIITSDFFDDGITHYDGAYKLDFNCYPIDAMVEYYEEKKRKGLVKQPD